MSDVVIKVENLSKKYIIGHQRQERYTALRDVLTDGAKNLAKRLISPFTFNVSPLTDTQEDFYALRDVSFEINRGDRVGIIGRNGAGKSTLLKILSRITEPTSGRIEIDGRVASLLEVGTGFHPELTGRENIFLNGAILGMTKAEIKRKFDEIVDFAEIEKFLDTPVKRYSSGMYVRLAFAVAAHLEPEILIVDEVLAVGDAQFQKKCLGKMEEVGKEGRTILFVSHNMQAVSTLTNNALFLSEGQIKKYDKTNNVIKNYLVSNISDDYIFKQKSSTKKALITCVALKTSEPNNVHVCGKELEIQVEITTPRPLQDSALSVQVINTNQQPVIHLRILDSENSFCCEPGIYRLICTIPNSRLYMGSYTITIHFSEKHGKANVLKIEDVCPFEIVMYGMSNLFGWQPSECIYMEDYSWCVSRIDE